MSNKYTKSTTFIMPMIARSVKDYPGFVNCYIRDESKPNLKLHIFVVQEEKKIPKLFYHKNPFLQSNYSIDGFKIWIYKVPETLLEDYYHFEDGEYSQFSKKYKNILCSNFPKLETNRFTGEVIRHGNFKIIYPTKQDRIELADELDCKVSDLPKNAEIISKPKLEEETFNRKVRDSFHVNHTSQYPQGKHRQV